MPETISNISHLRRTARCMIESLGIPSLETDDLESIIGELATNVVRHAKGDNYFVNIEFSGYQAAVAVVDK